MNYIVKGRSCDWEIVVGLEVHAQITSGTKLFSNSLANFAAEPNTHVSYFDAAMPGLLPLINKFCVQQAVKTALAISADLQFYSAFDRKSYFYPDLPFGYQITQFHIPIALNGSVELENGKRVSVERIHLEQDAGKSIHENGSTYVDLNRAGVALMEIVSSPGIHSPDEAVLYVKGLRQILRYIGTCDCDMEKGSFRIDANVSVRPKGESKLGTRCEIKNLNSFKFLMNGIISESRRHVELIESGGEIKQSTVLFDPDSGLTKVMRDKESALDYRYFPDPNILPIRLTESFVAKIEAQIPELPMAKVDRYVNSIGIKKSDALILIEDINVALFFEKLIEKHRLELVVNWVINELFGRLKKRGLSISNSSINEENFSQLLDYIESGVLSWKMAKDVLDNMFDINKPPKELIEDMGLQQIVDPKEIEVMVEKVMRENSSKVEEYKLGKANLFNFFVGQVMKASNGRVNPQTLKCILEDKLSN